MIRLNSRIFIIIFDFLFNNFFDSSNIVFQIININQKKEINFVVHLILFCAYNLSNFLSIIFLFIALNE